MSPAQAARGPVADRLLAMLAAGADTAALRTADPEGTDPRAVAHALAVQGRIDAQQERERALSALVESTQELAGHDEVDAVLASIVSRARRLLLADAAYFLTHDTDTGVSQMHVSEGIVSEAFMSLAVPSGVGITGFVAASRTPSWTADYPVDARYHHTGVIDAATAEEGLRAVLAVPVLHEGRMVGLLVAADRHPHRFRPQDVELLYALAQHAGVLIDAATGRDRDRADLAAMTASMTALRSDERAAQKVLALQDRMLSVLLNSGSLADLAAAARDVLGGTVVIADGAGRDLARAGTRDSVPDPAAGWSIEPLASAGMGTVAHHDDGQSADPGLDERRQSLVRVGSIAALMISALEADLSSAWEFASSLVAELLRDPEGDDAAVRRTAITVDVESLGTALVALTGPSGRSARVHRAAGAFVERYGGLAAELPDAQVLLWLPAPGAGVPAAGAVAAAAAERLTEAAGHPVTVGASTRPARPAVLAAAVDQARTTARALAALGKEGTGADADRVAPFPAILAGNAPDELDRFVRGALGALLDYDAAHDTVLTDTLAAVYTAGANVAAAAEALYAHPNTVHQRLARIDAVTGRSWRDPTTGMQFQLALTVRRLQAELPGPALRPPPHRPRSSDLFPAPVSHDRTDRK